MGFAEAFPHPQKILLSSEKFELVLGPPELAILRLALKQKNCKALLLYYSKIYSANLRSALFSVYELAQFRLFRFIFPPESITYQRPFSGLPLSPLYF